MPEPTPSAAPARGEGRERSERHEQQKAGVAGTWQRPVRTREGAAEDRELRQSEEKYRTLFEAFDEGYSLVEIIRDEDGHPVDMRYLEVNGVFERQTGLRDVAGKTHADLGLKTERHWFEKYAEVARTGVAIRFESYHEPTQRWYSVFASRPGGAQRDRVALVFYDATERKNVQVRQAFLLKLADGIRPLADPGEIKKVAARLLGEQLEVNRVFYAEVEGDDWIVVKGYEHGVKPLPEGAYAAGTYGRWIMETYRAGETIVFRDTQTDPRFAPAEREAHAAIQILAAVGVPLLKGGQLEAILAIHQAASRNWTEAEIALVEDTLGRTWDAVRRARAEQALRASEVRFRELSNSVPALIWINGLEGCEFVNREYVDFLGVGEVDVRGYDWAQFIHPEDRERYLETYRAAVADGALFEAQFRFRRHDGHYRWMKSIGVPRRTETGELLGYIGSSTDITDIRDAEQRLRASEERLRTLCENLPGGAAFVVDHELRYVLAEGAALRAAGYSPRDLEGKTIFEALPAELAARYEPRYRSVLGGGTFRHEHRDHERDFISHGTPLRDAEGRVRWALVVSYDITERKRAEEALQQSQLDTWNALQEAERARAEAVAAGKAKDHFLAMLSHELRTPLTPVLLGVQICRGESGLTPIVEDALEMIERNVASELRLIDDLLDMTRMERSKFELHRARIDLHEVMRRAIEVTRGEAEARAQRIEVQFTATAHDMQGDAARLQQVFWNLLRNACEFTPERGSITLGSRNDAPGRITITVTDTGIGFTPEQGARIFDAFAQATPDTARTYGGLGLGLAIARGILAAHGGSIRAGSPGPGRGATFTVELPVE